MNDYDEFIPYVPLTKKEKNKIFWDQVFSTLFVASLALGMGFCVGYISYELTGFGKF
jgi:hypothetical protein